MLLAALISIVFTLVQFNPAAVISDQDPLYNPHPTPEDQTHVVVLVIAADQITSTSLEAMKKMRRIAEEMGSFCI